MRNLESLKCEYLNLYSQYMAGRLVDMKRMWVLELLLGV